MKATRTYIRSPVIGEGVQQRERPVCWGKQVRKGLP